MTENPIPKSRVIRVTVDLDSRLWWKLAQVADRHNMSVDVLLSELAAKFVQPKVKPKRSDSTIPAKHRSVSITSAWLAQHREDMKTQVAKLYAQSTSDAEIGRALGVSTETARQVRLSLGLPARGRRGAGSRRAA